MDLNKILYYKKKKGYSNKKLAEITGIPLGTLQKILSGETKEPRAKAIEALEEALLPKVVYTYESGISVMDYIRDPQAAYNDPPKTLYTIDDYYALPDEPRVELIDGVFYDMASPSNMHQLIAGEIHRQIANYIYDHDGHCIPFIAPADVQLDCDNYTMVQPDFFIVCDPSIVLEQRCYGAPDFIVEVLSPSTRDKDMHIKASKYKKAGVKEYWMIDPSRRMIIVYLFSKEEANALPFPTIYQMTDDIPVSIYEGQLTINLTKLMKRLPPNIEKKV
ncbi:MAG: Uma2 family endonuclease [Lachnospiraceae bacterium]|nr:Uma2 family endonuclease [Candidatus Equihabitans merdae]